MSRKCQISNKKGRSANNVSHSKRRTKRRQEANIQTLRVADPVTGIMKKIKVCTRVLKTITRKGLAAVLKKNNVTI
jgi:large subunit ribosomal protein L28